MSVYEPITDNQPTRGGRGGRRGRRGGTSTQPRVDPAIEPTVSPEPATLTGSEVGNSLLVPDVDFPGKAELEASTRAIQEETRRTKARTDELVAKRKDIEFRRQTLQDAKEGPLNGWLYTPEQRKQLQKAGVKFTYGPTQEGGYRKPAPQPEPEDTPEEYAETAEKLNKQYYPELADKKPEEREYGFRYDPETGGVVAKGNPNEQVYDPKTGGTISRQERADQERADRLERARADMAEARAQQISIGELRERRRQIADAEHKRKLKDIEEGTTEKPGDPAGTATSAFSGAVDKSRTQFADAVTSGGDLKKAGDYSRRSQKENGAGPWAETPKTADRALFVDHVGALIRGTEGMDATKASILNEALQSVNFADVRFLLENPTAANGRAIEDLLLDQTFANENVEAEDVYGLGALILKAYGLEYKGTSEPNDPE